MENRLQGGKVGFGKASKKRVAVVQSGENQRLDQGFKVVFREEATNPPKKAQLVSSRLCNGVDYSGYRSPHNNMLNNENRSTVGRTGTGVVKIIRRPAPWRLPHRRREAGNLNFFISREHSHDGAGSRDGKAESRWFGCRCYSYERGS
ncbi:hypothetical protein NDU88_001892 [Pleurodeles waltl]|uniref:Uncharacterized protein n=1 Tax=Pleurodeles waltl TaxID=8319 RepID=A0AAV7V906_PLEWA|nr:hypothetical protein NDU88_001892 [Pleurodeles waltl]